MKKILKILSILLGLGLIAGLVGCPADDGKGNENDGGTEVSFQDFRPPSIWVENLTGERLIAFVGAPNPNSLISGIPAYSGQHGLRKDDTLFHENRAFVLTLITEAQYNANKNNLGAIGDSVFARIFAFYNHRSTNSNVFQISAKIGGAAQLQILNSTPFNVEIRSGSPTGEILGYAAAQATRGNVIPLNIATYDIYPVFKFFSPDDRELYSVTPKYTDGDLEGKPFMTTIGFVAPDRLIRDFDVSEIYDAGSFNLTTGSVYLRINNRVTGTDIQFWENAVVQITSLGAEVIFLGSSETFALRFPRNPDGTYPEKYIISALRIGTTNNRKDVPSFEYELDYLYEIDMTGTNASNMALGNITQLQKLDLERKFGLNQ